MAAKTNWHRYGTKLRQCHPVCTNKLGLSIHPSIHQSIYAYVYIRGVGLLHRICGHDTIAVLHLYNIFI